MNERQFADAFVSMWSRLCGGWYWRIPDSYHVSPKGKHYSAKRPADYLLCCRSWSALLETKWTPNRTVRPALILQPSQRKAIAALSNDLSMRYWVVIGRPADPYNAIPGTFIDAYAFDGSDFASRSVVTFADENPLGWYSGSGADDRRMLD